MPAQPRFRGRVDIDLALAESGRCIELWARTSRHPNVPAFSGGLLDSWPAWAVDAIAICRDETAIISEYRRHRAHLKALAESKVTNA